MLGTDIPIIYWVALSLGGWITISIAGPCDHGWYYRNGICYNFNREQKTWAEANKTCTQLNATLVQIKYPDLHTYLAVTAATVFTEPYWIGLRRTEYYEYRNFNEKNATTLNWRDMEPNDGVGACVYSVNSLMVDSSCYLPYPNPPNGFMCQVARSCSDSTINMAGFLPPDLHPFGSNTCLMHKRFPSQERYSWEHCHVSCTERPGHLVHMTPEIDTFLRGRIGDYSTTSFWVAAKPFKEDVFYWLDGTKDELNIWANNQPNRMTEDCVIVIGGKWHDAKCGMTANFICEKEAYPFEPPTTTKPAASQFDCRCKCSRLGKNIIVNMTMDQLLQAIDQIKTELAVNKSSLSSVIRRKTSAGDQRQSAAIVGYIGTAILCVILGTVVITDVPSLLQTLKRLVQNICPASCRHQTHPKR